MIKSIEYLENWTLINGCVKVQFDEKSNGALKAQFDRKLISEMDALSLIEEFADTLIETFEKPKSPTVDKVGTS